MLRKLDIPWLIVLAGVVLLSMQLWRTEQQGQIGAWLEWYVGEAETMQPVPKKLALADDQTIVLHGKLGDSVIEINDGQVRFIQSPCRHQICVQSGWISQSGEVLACLPNEVALHVRGATRAVPEQIEHADQVDQAEPTQAPLDAVSF